MPKYEALIDCYGPVDGADCFTYAGDVIEGNIPENRQHHFKLLEGEEAEKATPVNDLEHATEEIRAWLKAHNVKFSHLLGLEKLRKLKEEEELKLKEFESNRKKNK